MRSFYFNQISLLNVLRSSAAAAPARPRAVACVGVPHVLLLDQRDLSAQVLPSRKVGVRLKHMGVDADFHHRLARRALLLGQRAHHLQVAPRARHVLHTLLRPVQLRLLRGLLLLLLQVFSFSLPLPLVSPFSSHLAVSEGVVHLHEHLRLFLSRLEPPQRSLRPRRRATRVAAEPISSAILAFTISISCSCISIF